MDNKKHILVISGGGSLIPAFVGAISELNDINKYNTFMGTSAGSIISLLLALEFDVKTIKDIIMKFDFSTLYGNSNLIVNSLRTIKYYGYHSTTPLKDEIERIFNEYDIDLDKTFNDIKNTIDLNITVTNLTKNKTEVWNRVTNPKMKLIDAVVTSCSIPLFFTPTIVDGQYYCDGGLLDNFNIHYYEDKIYNSILGIKLTSDDMKTDNIINSIYSYSKALVMSIYIDANRINSVEFDGKIIDIDVGKFDSFNFNITDDDKINLFNIGVNSILH